jgi:hypothetical protein
MPLEFMEQPFTDAPSCNCCEKRATLTCDSDTPFRFWMIDTGLSGAWDKKCTRAAPHWIPSFCYKISL